MKRNNKPEPSKPIITKYTNGKYLKSMQFRHFDQILLNFNKKQTSVWHITLHFN